MKDSRQVHNKSIGLKSNGGMHHDMTTNLGKPTDIGNAVIPLQLSRLVKVATALAVGSFAVGTIYMSFEGRFTNVDSRLDRLECGQKMIVDVVVYKKPPEQPNCQ